MTEDQQAAVDFRNGERVGNERPWIGQQCGNCEATITAADGEIFVTDEENPAGFYLCAGCDADCGPLTTMDYSDFVDVLIDLGWSLEKIEGAWTEHLHAEILNDVQARG